MNREWLSQQMKALSGRVGILLQYAHAHPSQQLSLLPEALEELGSSLEELRVSQEVLHQQNQELLEAHVALDRERQRYRELFEFAPDAYLVTDIEGTIQEANRAASGLLNVPQPQLIGQSLTTFVPKTEQQSFADELNRLPQVGRLQEWMTRLQPQNADCFDAALTVTIVCDQSGTVTNFRWLLRNISERKQLEAAQLRATIAETTNKALEAEIARRQQLESELRRQAESLKQASILKDEFLAIVSHELRSPLNAMLGWTQILRSRKLNETIISRALETIERNARAQVKLIEDLLDISRIIRGNLRLNIHPVNLVSVLQAVIDSMQLAVTAKNIEVQTLLDESAGLVSGDPDRLHQLFWNLLSNAIKFTPRGGQIEIHLERLSSYAVVTISDNGQGIHPDFLPFVFDRFRQAERATTRQHGGLGLGLAIVQQLAEMHGGIVEATSPGEGHGATFTVRLPLMAVRLDPSEVVHASEAGESLLAHREAPALDNVDVLVVDDEADTRELLKLVLERAGANVKAAASVKEALQVIQQSQPDVLISDVGMPDQDGYALIRQVRQIKVEKHSQIPAIALTASNKDEDCNQLLDAGFQLHLSKPVEPDTLVAAVASQIDSLN